ncbi:MAG: class I SAM-dependent methyltransferase [Chloroflexi bacterium]|nr:class I SAM-dependent methyltransferase [Chloroflexota bacterium]
MSSKPLPVTDALLSYVRSHLNEHPVLADLRERTQRMPQASLQIGPEQGAFMALLVGLTGARRLLEIGTFTGYSSTVMALALPDGGRITCCDVSEEWTDVARQAWTDAGVADRCELRLGPAADTLRMLESGAHDLAFIDADKTGYDTYYTECLRLVRRGGLILLDNTLQGGRVADAANDEESTRAIRAVNDRIAADDRVESVILPLADGLTMVRIR